MSEEMPSVAPQRVRFIYEKPESCDPTYVNGVQGGIKVRGELFCNFFFEFLF